LEAVSCAAENTFWACSCTDCPLVVDVEVELLAIGGSLCETASIAAAGAVLREKKRG
jgi:hypothetical protein